MWKNIGTGGLAQGKILGVLAFYTWVVGDLTGQALTQVPSPCEVAVLVRFGGGGEGGGHSDHV